ncbi:MAG TPA: inorganic diphosphatase [Thermodesulfobacteriota bacterium]|nr:inorganic diphosphatase [Thermodesulfobacteriota bacterium]
MIEIPRGSRNKYEWDRRRGAFRLDRVLYASVHYPGDYGFIPDTLAEDGDPLDILVLVEQPSFTGCLIEARPVGMLEMADDKGRDLKILAVPAVDPRFDEIADLSALPGHWKLEIAEFFEIYKRLEGKRTDVGGWHGAAAAWAAILEAEEAARRAGGEGVISLASLHLPPAP